MVEAFKMVSGRNKWRPYEFEGLHTRQSIYICKTVWVARGVWESAPYEIGRLRIYQSHSCPLYGV